jgi:hypothetical protein
MAEGKKSFILYADLANTVEHLPDEKAGILFKTILDYVNDRNPVIDDLLIRIAFEPIKQQLKRDLQVWESERVNRSESGRLGGLKSGETRRKKKEANEANEAKVSTPSKKEANEAVNVIVTVNDNVNKIDVVGDKSPIHPQDEFTEEQQKSYQTFLTWIDEHAPKVNKMKEPFTIKQYFQMVENGFDASQIKQLLADMHNWKDLLKKRESAYLTLTNWKRREYAAK